MVGNPVRQAIAELGARKSEEAESNEKDKQNLRVLVIGGSLGAVAINKTIPAMLALMSNESRPEVLHQCGKRNLEETQEFYREHKIETGDLIRLKPFIENMAKSYQWADIIIARSGAMTVSEIATVGLASILIPYPYAVDDHQTENAGYLVRAGAADIVQQDTLDAHKLKQLIEKYSENRSVLKQASDNARLAGSPEATEKAAMLCMEACYA